MNTIDSSDLQQIHNAIDNLMNAMTDEGTQNVGIQITRIGENGEHYVSNYTVSVNIQFAPKEEPVAEPEPETPSEPETQSEPEPESPSEPEIPSEVDTPTEPEQEEPVENNE